MALPYIHPEPRARAIKPVGRFRSIADGQCEFFTLLLILLNGEAAQEEFGGVTPRYDDPPFISEAHQLIKAFLSYALD